MKLQQAQKEAQKRWGKTGFARMNESSSSPERREKARVIVRESRERINAINAEIQERLNALPWYQELIAERQKMNKAIRDTEGGSLYYKFQVGSAGSLFATIHGSGDTFAEAFAQADKSHG